MTDLRSDLVGTLAWEGPSGRTTRSATRKKKVVEVRTRLQSTDSPQARVSYVSFNPQAHAIQETHPVNNSTTGGVVESDAVQEPGTLAMFPILTFAHVRFVHLSIWTKVSLQRSVLASQPLLCHADPADALSLFSSSWPGGHWQLRRRRAATR